MQSKVKHKLNSISRISKKAKILQDPDVQRWYKHLMRNSKENGETSIRRLYKVTNELSISPMQLVELADREPKELKRLLIDYLNDMEDRGYEHSYQAAILKAIKSWLRFNDALVDIPFKSSKITRLAKIQKLPDEQEYADIINRSDLRTRAIIALISKSGIRLQVIGNHDNSDGLRLKDIPDIQVINGRAICKQYPAMIRVRPELSKNRVPYITFLSKQGVRYLLAYLNDRLEHGEVLTDDSAIIVKEHRYGYLNTKPFRDNNLLNTKTVSKLVREVVNKYNIRPYDLRHWFATQLEIAVAKGKISHTVKEELMGHISGIEHHYTYAKYNLADELAKELREAYARCEEYLDLEIGNKDDIEELKTNIISKIANMNKEELLKVMNNIHNQQ